MTLRLSTGLRNAMLGAQQTKIGFINATTISFTHNTGSGTDTINDSGSGLVSAGFIAGDKVTVVGSTSNDGTYVINTAAAGALTVAETLTTEAAGDQVAMMSFHGGSLKEVFKDGVLKIYSGTQPTSADDAVAGSLLVQITVGSGAFTPGSPANGLEFGTAASGSIAKSTSETWSGVATGSGTAGWFRLCANATDAGSSSTTLARIDGSVGTSGAELNMSSTSITSGATTTIDSFTITLPAA